MFVRDIAPELARDRGFQIVRERRGQLVFADGATPGADLDSLVEGDAEAREEPWNEPNLNEELGARISTRTPALLRAQSMAGEDLPQLLPRHIRVDFSAEGSGTSVHVHGHVERDVRHGLELLGTPQHWPEIADRPHD
jgi:hypothetical protein